MNTRPVVLALIFALLTLSGCIAKDFPARDNTGLGDDAGDDAGDVADAGDGSSDPDAADVSDASDTSEPDASACAETCADPTPFCNEDTGECVECTGDDQCSDDVGHHTAVCGVDNTCKIQIDNCVDGYVNLDDTDPNCECHISDPTDVPDAAGEDTNCDGVDGIAGGEGNVIFVDPASGDDTNDGYTAASAKATLQQAIDAAHDQDRSFVMAVGATFAEKLTLRDGVSIYGGYVHDGDTWQRDTANEETVVEPPASTCASSTECISVVAEDISRATTLDQLTIHGLDAQKPGASSYVVWAKNADGLTIQNSAIVAGKGARGANGVDGTDGDARTCNAEGGAGGQAITSTPQSGFPCNADAEAGTNGDAGVLPNNQISPRRDGSGGTGGAHDCPSILNSCSTGDGEPGAAGLAGDPGEHGVSGDSWGAINSNGLWVGAEGSLATDGENGTGGGGGGAGGSCAYAGGLAQGDDGGDGSDGGCGGVHGGNGQAGGASFGIFAWNSALTVSQLDITQAVGGQGGDGGDGGTGQGSPNNQTAADGRQIGGGNGGDGGAGGAGGDGGAGAGGCGGPSIGIAKVDSTFDVPQNMTFTKPSEGAKGGINPWYAGPSPDPNQCNGEVETVYDFGSTSN